MGAKLLLVVGLSSILTVSCDAAASGVELGSWNDTCTAMVAEADAALGGGSNTNAKRLAWAECMRQQGAECVATSTGDNYTCRSTTGTSSARMEAPY